MWRTTHAPTPAACSTMERCLAMATLATREPVVCRSSRRTAAAHVARCRSRVPLLASVYVPATVATLALSVERRCIHLQGWRVRRGLARAPREAPSAPCRRRVHPQSSLAAVVMLVSPSPHAGGRVRPVSRLDETGRTVSRLAETGRTVSRLDATHVRVWPDA